MAEKMRELAGLMQHLTPYPVFRIGPVTIDSTVVNTWIAMAILFALVYWLSRGLSTRPGRRQALLEAIVGFVANMAESDLGDAGRRYIPWVGTLLLFILVMNLSWFIPNMIPPTTDLSTTAALAVTTILFVHIEGIRRGGWKYVKRYFQPMFIMFPLNIMEELVKPVSLAVRLYGNMFGGKLVVLALGILVPLLVPVPIMLLEVLLGSIQAYIFAILTVAYLDMMFRGH